jgi:hypothetical protein
LRPSAALSRQDGQALILAVAVLAAVSLLAAGMTRAAWDATRSPLQAHRRAQTAQAALSAAELHLAVLRRSLRDQLVPNILDQGCRQQNDVGTQCTVPGNDTAGTSGIRKDRIQQLADQSDDSWDALQQAFVEALRQVMPLAPEQDRFRNPAVYGFAGLVLRGVTNLPFPQTAWRSYGIVAPVPGNPITYDATLRKATIKFELRAYGWASTGASGPGRAHATAYATIGSLTMTYPDCPSYWSSPPDQICSYPSSVQLEIPDSYVVLSDPAVRWVEP